VPTSKEKRRRLAVFADKANYVDPPEPVTLGDVLYSPPNLDDSRKMCQNCIHWLRSGAQCELMLSDVVVPPDAICGYHVFGTPRPVGHSEYYAREGFLAIDPALSGFEQVSGGTSCDRCKFYSSARSANFGKCSAVIDDEGASALVADKGCCARWRDRDGG